MHHTLGWRLSLADATETDLTPVPDTIFTIQNGHFLPQDDWFFQTFYFGAASPTRCRIVTPTMRQITTPFIRPMNNSIVPGNLPGIADYRSNPLRTKGLEEVQIMATQTAGAAAVAVASANISKGPLTPMPQGDVDKMVAEFRKRQAAAKIQRRSEDRDSR